jgi:hypothetical protein
MTRFVIRQTLLALIYHHPDQDHRHPLVLEIAISIILNLLLDGFWCPMIAQVWVGAMGLIIQVAIVAVVITLPTRETIVNLPARVVASHHKIQQHKIHALRVIHQPPHLDQPLHQLPRLAIPARLVIILNLNVASTIQLSATNGFWFWICADRRRVPHALNVLVSWIGHRQNL